MAGVGTPERGAPRISLSQSNNFTCWPSIVTASRSPRIWPNGSFACPMLPSKIGTILNMYSPSAGNSCSISVPPRVPNGSPWTW